MFSSEKFSFTHPSGINLPIMTRSKSSSVLQQNLNPSTSSDGFIKPRSYAKKRKVSANIITPTSNGFKTLPDESDSENEMEASDSIGVNKKSHSLDHNNSKKNPRNAKPIFIDAGYPVISNVLKNIDLADSPSIKIMGPRKCQVICKSFEDKQKLINKVKSQEIKYFSFSEPHEKPAIYVLKGLHKLDPAELLDMLKTSKVPATKVSFLVENDDYPVYLVHFERQIVNLKMLQVVHKVINPEKNVNIVAIWEKLDRSRKRLTQCRNCQRFGHSASNCGQSYRCVKCTDLHGPGDCARKTKEGTPKCINCHGDHTANSRVCKHYEEYQQRVSRQRSTRRVTADRTVASAMKQQNVPKFNQVRNFPPLSTENVSSTRNASASCSGTASYAHVVSNSKSAQSRLEDLQLRLAAIPSLDETLDALEKFVSDLETAKNERERRSAMLRFLMLSNGN